jgi:hypothetical protein
MEMLKKYWWAIAAVVVFMMMGGKKHKGHRVGSRTRRKMKALRYANARLRRRMMYRKSRPIIVRR